MSLYFHSDYSKATLYLAVGLPDTSCALPAEFRKQGWWKIPYGDTVEVWSGDLALIVPFICYYYVQGTDGSYWAGGYNVLVSDAKFKQCWLNDTGMTRNIGCRYLNTGSSSNFTLNLVP
jgi:uncharacterized membrane protein